MLVLTIKPGGFFRIGDNIDVVFSHMKGKSAVIGIEAPKETPVLRGELCGQGGDGKSQPGEIAP